MTFQIYANIEDGLDEHVYLVFHHLRSLHRDLDHVRGKREARTR